MRRKRTEKMKRHILLVLLAVFAVFAGTFLTNTEDVAASSTSGKCGDNLTWSYSNGVLTISGTGDMYDYSVYDTPSSPYCMPWYDYRSSITTINISEGVTSIGSDVFREFTALTSVTTPSTIETIGFAAFADCTSLKEVTIKSGYVGESAFIRCTSLTKVTVGNGVTGFGISAFENCTALEGVYISSVESWCAINFGGLLANPLTYAHHIYLNGTEITSLQIPSGVTSINAHAFEYAYSITSISIPSGVTSVEDYAFYDCRGLTSVTLPSDGLTYIGASAFAACNNVLDFAIPDSVSYVGAYAFAYTQIATANVQQGVIEDYAFVGCGCMVSATLGSGVTSIGDGAFSGCAALKTVYYGGSKSQWYALSIGEDNSPLTSAEVICSGTGSATNSVDTSTVYVGATVKFGSYEQDNDTSDGKEDIEWTVLAIDGEKALVISDRVLDFQQYYGNHQDTVSWANSYVRSWLNSTFLNEAFTSSQQSSIYTTTVTASDNTVFGISGGSDTSDKIFLLSAEEAEEYFESNGARTAGCTAYALSRNSDSALYNSLYDSSYWWLRTPGMFDYNAMYVNYTGGLEYDGMAANNVIGGVRPAMWVNINAVEYEAPEEEENLIESFVTRLYEVCLNREPDADGLADWVNWLANGQETGASAAYGFIFSTEFQNYNYCNTDYVKQLYRAFMGREYDEAGLADWVARLESGTTREEVFNGFSQSPEFQNICSEYGITLGDPIEIPQYGTVPHGACSVCGETDGVTAFVTRLYNICLDRDPDEAGLADWTGQLWAHTKSGRDVAYGFIFSQEFINKNLDDESYIEYLYRAFFGREYDEAGKADWLNHMQSMGYSREDVFDGFVGSEEFNNLCKKYGIVRD
ncbi:MAG: leucine-rich repeat protein [Lachnospiraceae bacterium]|nr:leucine-rich repeat protein [Lachnospiraceae bacterium]